MSGHVWTFSAPPRHPVGSANSPQPPRSCPRMPASLLERKMSWRKVKSFVSFISFASLTSFQGQSFGLLSFSLWTKACRLAVPLVELLVSESLLQRRICGWYDIGETAMKSCASRCGCYITFRAKSQKVLNLRWQTRRRQRKNTWILKVYFSPPPYAVADQPLLQAVTKALPQVEGGLLQSLSAAQLFPIGAWILMDAYSVRFCFCFCGCSCFLGCSLFFDFNHGPVWVGLKISYLSTG